MAWVYEGRVTMPDGGHLAAGAVRDGLEDALSGALESGEEAVVGQESATTLLVTLTTAGEMGDREAELLGSAVADVLRDCAEPGKPMAFGGFELRSWPGMAP